MRTQDEVYFKIAGSTQEYEQIHHLNYITFVEEIPQHTPNQSRQLIDKFNEDNTYIIAVHGLSVIGMLALKSKRPFSLDQKLSNLDSYLPAANKICEIRLLSVLPAYRNSRVLAGLLRKTVEYGISQGIDLGIISGIVSQQRLYKNMGFIPFGPTVGNKQALFQPMYMVIAAETSLMKKVKQYSA